MTGYKYYAMLDKVEQEQFYNNFKSCRVFKQSIKTYLKDLYVHFDEFIGQAFIFLETPEGHNYWRDIKDSMRDGVDASKYRENKKEMLRIIVIGSLEPRETLEDVLSELNITLQKDEF